MDIEGLERLLTGLESGAIRVIARDLTEPSPLALEVLSARPYAYLDDAPLEERRTQAVMSRRWLAPEEAGELGRLDPEAIERVRAEAWPEPANADELHDALVWLGFLGADEARTQAGMGALGWRSWRATSGRRCCMRHRRRCGSPPSVCRSSRHSGPTRGWSRRSPLRKPMRGQELVARRGADRHPARPPRGLWAGDGERAGGAAGTDA